MNRVWYLIKLAEELGFNVSRLMGKSANVLPIQKPNLTKSGIKIETATDKALDNELTETINLARNNKLSGQELEQSIRNLENIKAARNAPKASVYDFAKKEQVSPEGVKTLIQEKGQIAKPGTPLGNVDSRVKQLEAKVKEKGMTLDDVMKDVMETQKTASKLQDEGLVRAAVRYKMMDDLKRGSLKLPKNLEDVVRGASNEEDVINVFRKNYGEDALEQVDSLVPDFYNMTSPTDAVKKIEKDFPNIKPRKIETKQTMDLEEAAKAEKENILIPDDTEEFATGGRVGFNEGSKLTDYLKTNISAKKSSSSPEEGVKIKEEILDGIVSLNIPLNKKLKLLGSLNFGKSRAKVDLSELGKKYGIDLGEQVYKDKYLNPGLGAEYITDEGTKFNLMVNPEDKGGSVSVSRSFATGGRVGFQEGGNMYYNMYQNYLNDLQNRASGDFSVPIGNMYQSTITNQDNSNETENTQQTSPVGSTFNPTLMDMVSFAVNPVMGIANLASRRSTGLSLAQRAMDAFGIGRGPGGRTQGYGVDSIAGMVSGPTFGVDAVNSQSVGADASAGGAAGAAAASAAGANDGPDTGGSFAQGGRVGYSTGSIVKGVLLTAKTLSELKPEYLKKLSRLEGYLGSINMEGKGGREAAKKTIEKIDNLKQEYKALEKDLSEKEQLDKFDTTDRSKNARGGVAYLMGL